MDTLDFFQRTGSDMIGVVHCKMTGAVRRIIIPDNDRELDNHPLHRNETMVLHRKIDVSHDISKLNLIKIAKARHAYKFHSLATFPEHTPCAVVDATTRKVIKLIEASPYIDTIEGCVIVFDKGYKVGDLCP